MFFNIVEAPTYPVVNAIINVSISILWLVLQRF